MTTQTLDSQLLALSLDVATTPAGQNKLAATIAAFMQKNAAELDSPTIAQAIYNLANNGEYAADVPAMLAIVDNLAPGQAGTLGGQNLDTAFLYLAGGSPITLQQLNNQANQVENFLGVLGPDLSPTAIVQALNETENLGEVRAILNNLTPAQLQQVGGVSYGGATLGNALVRLSQDGLKQPYFSETLTLFMARVGFEIPPSFINTALNNLAAASNYQGVLGIVSGLVPGQAASLSGPVFDQTFEYLAGYGRNGDPAPASAAVFAEFMQLVGQAVSPAGVTATLAALAGQGDYSQVSAIVDNLHSGQAATLASPDLDQTLIDLTAHPDVSGSVPAASAATIADFMQKVGAEVSPSGIDTALVSLAGSADLAGVQAVVGNLAPGQASTLGGFGGSDTPDTVLLDISQLSTEKLSTPAAIAATTADLMQKIGAEITAGAVSEALSTFAVNKYYSSVTAVVDNLAPGQAASLGGYDLDMAMSALSEYPPSTTTPSGLNPTIADFMQKVGAEVSANGVGAAIFNLSYEADQAGLKGVINNLAPGQAATLSPSNLDESLVELSQIPATTSATQNALANTLADYMKTLGTYLDASAINTAVANLEKAGDQVAANAIIDNEPDPAVLNLHTQTATMVQAMAAFSGSGGPPSAIAPASTAGDHIAILTVHG